MQNSKRFWRSLFFIMLITALCGGLALPLVEGAPAQAAPQMQTVTHIVISQVYGGGGNTNAPYTNDYVELFNPSDTPLPLDGWSVQYAAASGSSFTNVANLSGSLAAGQYYLVQLGSMGSIGIALPTPDATGTTNISARDGKVVLANTTTNIPCNGGSTCTPTDLSSIVDLVGYGTADSYEGNGAAPAPTNRTADLRNFNGCNDTDDNSVDFTEGTPLPRNSAFGPITTCVDQFTATAVAADLTGTASAANLTGTASALTSTAAAVTNVPQQSVIINEVAWGGTTNSDDEWIELYNPSATATVNLTGWRLRSSDNTPDIPLSGSIAPNSFLVFARRADTFQPQPPVSYTVESTIILSNSGEILRLIDSDNRTIDTANSDGGSWPAGTGSPTYASMERVGTLNQWATYGGTVPVAYDRNSNPVKGTPGRSNWISTATITTITADTPDPSLVNQNVTVTVTVIGGMTIPTGTVSITGANTNCTITLSGGTGSCLVNFTSTGTKTLTATYGGDASHPVSSDTESHQVSTTVRTPTPTRPPTPLPPPPLIVINEFVPRPGHDWNMDGVINVGDEYIELLNHGVVDVDLSGYSLDDEVNIGSNPYRLPSITLKPGERHVFYGSETGLLLGDGGDGVRLLKPNGQLGDAYNYSVVRFPDQSYCRLPDNGGADDWNQNCFPTPGLQNSLSGSSVNPPTSGSAESLCPIADTLPADFVLAECLPFGNNIWNSAYWDEFGWYEEENLPESPGKWPVFAD